MKRTNTTLTAFLVLLASTALAQTPDRTSFASEVVKRVAVDPTTYAPTIVAWTATRLDWQSSQVFFRNGFVENNPRFTTSGLTGDAAIGYGAGNRKILRDALANLQISVINNVTGQVVERLLTRQYPRHRKLVRTLGWIERSAMASYLTYELSAGHFRQWRVNEAGQEQFQP